MEIFCSFIQPLMSCIQPLMSCIGATVIRQFGYLKAKEHVDELIRRAGDLEAKKKDIQNEIDAASRDGKQCTHEVRRWIEKVEGLQDEVRTVQTNYEQRGRCWPSYKIGRRASKLLIKLTDLDEEQAGFDVLATDVPPTSDQQMSGTSNVVGNMLTLNKEKICRYLGGEETDGVIGVWGMGGVGKTTLLEAINDNYLPNNNIGNYKLFDHVVFIVVSKEYQIDNLQKILVEKLGLRSREGLVSQAHIISEYLKEKNFLLLLDDIWKVVQLKDLGIPYPHSSSTGRRFRRKVVFTTRSEEVCRGMNCQGRYIIKMECLEEDEAWDLFKKNVGEDIIDLPGIRSRAEELIKECGGLPLALVVIGRTMATKRSPQEWDYALTQLRKSQPNNIPGMEMEEDYYFPRLKLSYDNLRDDKMRECFLCCSLWPEDFEIEKEELIMCWMGLGLIDDFEDINEAYDEGYSLIGSLTTASLLEPVREKDNVVKLHDVIRDLALWIARDNGKNINRWLVKARVGPKEVPSEVVAKWGVAERISLMKNKIKELAPHLPLCSNLSTLLLQYNQLTGIPEGFFTCMPNLTYLDLSHNRFQEIPKEICRLVQLRYLNLSFTNISIIPEELGRLINLKYLLLRCTNIRGGEVISRIIGRLEKLEYLDIYPSGFVETNELLRLPPLLKGLGMKITSEDALQQLSRVVPPILYLKIEDMGGDSSTTSIHLDHLLSSRTKLSLRYLWFRKWRSISIREVDVDVRLPRLEWLLLSGLENLTVGRSVVPPSVCFERLRGLRMQACNGLKDITWVLHLPCLEDLDVSACKEMEQVVVIGGGGEEVTKPTFPSLKYLYLFNLPKLAMICDNHAAAVNFPSLEVLYVGECNGLKKLPFHPQLLNNCSRLEKIYGDREWWESIEWEDQSAQSSLLQPYFHDLSGYWY